MPYTPTVWVNNQPPALSAANLDKLTNELESQAAAIGLAHSLPDWTDGAAPAITDATPWNELERVAAEVASSQGLSYTPTVWESGWTPARNAARLNALERIVQLNREALDSVTTGTLRWRPPNYVAGDPALLASYTGMTEVTMPSSRTLSLPTTGDYLVNLGHVQWSSGGSRTQISIQGGRNVVIIGGQITYNQTNNTDQLALEFIGGNPAGTVHVEGLLIASSVNGFTLRDNRTYQLQNCHVKVDSQGFPGPHGDIVQSWRAAAGKRVRMHRFTGYTDYTSLVCLEAVDPTTWELYDVDIHGWTLSSGLRSGCATYHNSSDTPPSGPYTTWIGSNLWMHPGHYNASTLLKLDDQCIVRYLPGQQGNAGMWSWAFEMYPGPGNSGSKYTSPDPAAGGTGPYPLGTRQGDYLTFERVPHLSGHRWTYGVAPTSAGALNSSGEFVPASLVGMNYTSPRYL